MNHFSEVMMTYLHIFTRHCATKLGNFAAKLKRAQSGVSAVEFALIAPIMVIMLFGATEVSLLVTVDRKTTIAASTLGDLASQTDLVACAELSQISAVTRQVFEPYSGADASMVVANLMLDGGAAKVEWSKYLHNDVSGNPVCDDVPGSHSLAVGKTVVVDATLFATGGGVVVGDVEKVHTTVGTSFMANNLVMHERFYLRPRKSAKLKWCTDTTYGVTAQTCSSTT
jgi:Flp pilus assembly protein TadG